MAQPSIALLPRSPRRHLTHRPGTSRGAILRLHALAATITRMQSEGRGPDALLADDDIEVATVLEHLVPIRSRGALAASYAREGRRLTAVHLSQPRTPGPVDAIDVAYALRWLQLGEPAPAR